MKYVNLAFYCILSLSLFACDDPVFPLDAGDGGGGSAMDGSVDSGPTDAAVDTSRCDEEGELCCPGATCAGEVVCVGGLCAVALGACGELEQACCEGSCNSSSLLCEADVCVLGPCGQRDQACCRDGESCEGELACDSREICTTCGLLDGPCCPTGDACRAAGLACDVESFSCRPVDLIVCGGFDRACCPEEPRCAGGLRCESFGGPGGGGLDSGVETTDGGVPSPGFCVSEWCGEIGAPCCTAGPPCDLGLACDAATGPPGSCVPCGIVGAPCCDVAPACAFGATCGDAGSCVAS